MSCLTDLVEGFAGTELHRVVEQIEALHAERQVLVYDNTLGLANGDHKNPTMKTNSLW